MSSSDPASQTAEERRLEQSGELSRLRDRTDEIELIISGVTTLALFTLPGWLIERYAEHYTHLSLWLASSSTIGLVLLSGICYGLGCCFLVHLLARAYWVGLIGLRTVFPSGVDWRRTPGIGPTTRDYYRIWLPDLATAIARSDRLASSLFAVISMMALIMLWLGGLVLGTVVVGAVIGAQFGATNRGIGIGFWVLVAVAGGVPVLLWLLDAGLARLFPGLRQRSGFRRLIEFMVRFTGVVLPQRLVLPVQLTLQSNTRPIVFLFLFMLGVFFIGAIGNFSVQAAQRFSMSGEFTYLATPDLGDGFRSSFYEDARSPRDRFRPWPMIPSFEQQSGHVRLFLPYWPLRDNLILDRLCSVNDTDEPSLARVDCLRRLWSVSFNDQPVDMADFMPTERMDLRMLGLTGAIPLYSITPGIHRIQVTWNPESDADALPVDDRYMESSFSFSIPFLFSPDYEIEIDEDNRLTLPPP